MDVNDEAHSWQTRPLTADDENIVWEMLMYAAHETSLESIRSQPALAQYAEGYGRPGDLGFVALCEERPVGAAWVRLWSSNEFKGYAFISKDIPELAIAVVPEYRGRGVGSNLLQAIISAARETFSSVSLSCRNDNPAMRLYERAGFVRVPGTEVENRVGGVSVSMLLKFDPK